MQNKTKILIGIVIVAALGGLGYFLAQKSSQLPAENNQQKSEEEQKAQGPVVENGVYKNKKFGFSLAIPEGFRVTENNPDDSSFVMLAETDDPKAKRSFQIFVMPFDEPGPINKERILIDMPDAVVDDPRDITLAGVPALVFWGSDESLGKTREVWFVHGGYLFQISSYASFDEELSKIMATFQFN